VADGAAAGAAQPPLPSQRQVPVPSDPNHRS
jgi:hypothetical protein